MVAPVLTSLALSRRNCDIVVDIQYDGCLVDLDWRQRSWLLLFIHFGKSMLLKPRDPLSVVARSFDSTWARMALGRQESSQIEEVLSPFPTKTYIDVFSVWVREQSEEGYNLLIMMPFNSHFRYSSDMVKYGRYLQRLYAFDRPPNVPWHVRLVYI